MNSLRITQWTIDGAEGNPIFGNTHLPKAEPRGSILLVHGFMGYKDYGFFPFLAQNAAQHGLIAHRFNLSSSGITNEFDTFARPDLFATATWKKNVADIDAVIDAVARNELAGKGLPYLLYGHSRGGLGVLFAAGHRFLQGRKPLPAGVISVAAPSRPSRMTDRQQRQMLEDGFIEAKSGRTGQVLRIEKPWLQEQIDDPDWHNAAAAVAAIDAPLFVIHGSADLTVKPGDAAEIAANHRNGAPTRRLIVQGANHVINTPNPFPLDASPGEHLALLRDEILQFADQTIGR